MNSSGMGIALALLLAPLLMASCDTPDGGPPRDDMAAGQAELFLVLGEDAYPEPVHPVTGVLLSDSLIVVSDRSRLHRFTAVDLQYLDAVGRPGAGPGEFQRIAWIQWLPGGRTAVYDDRLRRVTVLLPDLTVQRTMDAGSRVPSASARPRCMAGEDQLVATVWINQPTAVQEGLGRGDMEVLIVKEEQDSARLVESIPAAPVWIGVLAQGGVIQRLLVHVPFTPAPIVRCGGERVFWGDGSRPSLASSGPLGEAVVLELPGLRAAPVTEEDRRRHIDSLVAVGEHDIARLARSGLQAFNPQEMPYFRAFFVDSAAGTIWVQHYRLNEEGHQVWSLFSPNGGFLRRISFPPEFQIHHVLGERAAGVWLHESGIQEVRVYILP
jgi:hypothetical protein